MKKCNDCGLSEPDVEFTLSRKYNCKSCVRKRNQEYSLKIGCKLKFIPIVTDTTKQCCKCKKIKPLEEYSNSTRGRKGKAAYCKPCASNYQLNYTSKEERKANTQKYRDSNREWWRSLHRLNQFNRRNKVKAVSDGTVTQNFVKSIYLVENCYYCKEQIPEKFRTLEHKLPLNRGGTHSSLNIVMACLLCNTTKRDMTEEEFENYKLNKNNNE